MGKSLEKHLKTLERVAWSIGAIIALAAGVLLINELFGTDSVLDLLVRPNSLASSDAETIGKLKTSSNDARIKPKSAMDWRTARKDQDIAMGDAVFAGANSNAVIELNDGGTINVESNSMVVFRNINGQSVPSLAQGTFKLALKRKVTLEIGGKVVTVAPDRSPMAPNVSINVAKGKAAVIKVSRGTAKLAYQGKKAVPIKLEQKIAVNKDAPKPPPAPAPLPVAVAPSPPPPPPPVKPIELEREAIPSLFPAIVLHEWRFREIYEFAKEGETLSYRGLPASIEQNLSMSISSIVKEPGPCQVDLSNNETHSGQLFSYRGSCAGIQMARAFVGENFWRAQIKTGGRFYNGSFFLRAGFRPLRPQMLASDTQIPLINQNPGQAILFIKDSSRYQQLILELNHVEANERRSILLHSNERIVLPLYEPGEWQLRTRGIAYDGVMTEASELVSLNVFNVKPLEIPRLSKLDIRVMQGENASLQWNEVNSATRYNVSMYKEGAESKVASVFTDKHFLSMTAKTPGRYFAKVRAMGKYGLSSGWSRFAVITVKAPPPPPPIIVVQKPPPPPPERKLAEVVPELKTQIQPSRPQVNDTYSSSFIETDAGLGALYSSQQIQDGVDPASVALLTVRNMTWGRHFGFEGKISGQVEGSGVGSGQILDLEARVHLRTQLGSPIPALIKSMQVSSFIGVENFSNPGQTESLPTYQAGKIGLTTSFPISSRVETGGEVSYGMTPGGSTSLGAAGYVSVYLSRKWTVRTGYRASVFQAGSAAESVGGLPYREAYGEVFSGLQLHY